MSLIENIKNSLDKIQEDASIAQMLHRIKSSGDVSILGGALRDWSLNRQPRDIDVVVNCSASKLDDLLQHKAKKNRFGGFKIELNKVEFDIWNLDSTWAFKNDPKFNKKMEEVPETVFLNIDAIMFDLCSNKILDKGFEQAMESKLLDIVYEPNPYPYLCVSKALIALHKYDMRPSKRLADFIRVQLDNGYTQKSFNMYQKVNYGDDRIFNFEECLKRVGR